MAEVKERRQLDILETRCHRQEREIERLKRRIKDLEKLVTTDELTGCLNQRGLMSRLSDVLEDMKRRQTNHYSGSGDYLYALLFMDLDDFKPVNDNAGHQVGNEILVDLVDAIGVTLRKNDQLGRYGGDEFVIIARVEKEADAPLLSAKVERIIQEVTVGDGWSVGASVGSTFIEREDIALEEFIRRADQEMYKNKFEKKRKEAKNSLLELEFLLQNPLSCSM